MQGIGMSSVSLEFLVISRIKPQSLSQTSKAFLLFSFLFHHSLQTSLCEDKYFLLLPKCAVDSWASQPSYFLYLGLGDPISPVCIWWNLTHSSGHSSKVTPLWSIPWRQYPSGSQQEIDVTLQWVVKGTWMMELFAEVWAVLREIEMKQWSSLRLLLEAGRRKELLGHGQTHKSALGRPVTSTSVAEKQMSLLHFLMSCHFLPLTEPSERQMAWVPIELSSPRAQSRWKKIVVDSEGKRKLSNAIPQTLSPETLPSQDSLAAPFTLQDNLFHILFTLFNEMLFPNYIWDKDNEFFEGHTPSSHSYTYF